VAILEGESVGPLACAASIDDEKPYRLPTAALERIWRWNYTREKRAAALGEDIYVPRIFHFEVDGKLRTGIVWGDALGAFFRSREPLADQPTGLKILAMDSVLNAEIVEEAQAPCP
jgi:hypothetical protein